MVASKKLDLIGRLVAWREAKRLTQAEATAVFNQAGATFSRRSLENWECRRCKPQLDAAEVIIAVLQKEGF